MLLARPTRRPASTSTPSAATAPARPNSTSRSSSAATSSSSSPSSRSSRARSSTSRRPPGHRTVASPRRAHRAAAPPTPSSRSSTRSASPSRTSLRCASSTRYSRAGGTYYETSISSQTRRSEEPVRPRRRTHALVAGRQLSDTITMSLQAPRSVVMIRPHHFAVNPETAADNVFQSDDRVAPPTTSPAPRSTSPRRWQTRSRARRRACTCSTTTTTDRPDSVFPNNWFSTHTRWPYRGLSRCGRRAAGRSAAPM